MEFFKGKKKRLRILIINLWFQKISIHPPPPPHGKPLEIPRGRGGSRAVISEGREVLWETTLPKGDEPCTKH